MAWSGPDGLGRTGLPGALYGPFGGSEIGEEEMDGSRVWDFVQAGRLDDVAEYCRGDVERVRLLHRRLTFEAVHDDVVPARAAAGGGR